MKKLKWGLLTCLAVTSSVVPVLSTTACGKKTPEVNKIGAEYDKEYGVDQAVYAKLKNEFWNKREIQLRSDPEITTEAQIERARQDLNETFRDYDNQLASNPQLSYTAITNAMIDFASQTYGIRLTRQTSKKTATWDDLTAAFEGMVQSMNQYMVGSGIPESQRQIILEKAKDDFNGEEGLKNRIREQYDDPLLGLIKAKGEMLSCFSDINYDIGLVAASNRLKDFLEDYTIEYDDRSNDENKLDKLEENAKDWFKVGADLSKNDHILNIYKITRKVDGKPLEHFEPDKLLPSYTVKPFLKKISRNSRTNEYLLSIDWTCVKTAYLQSNDAEKVEKTTAHYYHPDATEIAQETDVTSAYETLKDCSKESSLDYPIALTKKGEAQAIADTYFNTDSEDGYISFGWDTNLQGNEINGYDGLFSGIPLQDHKNGETNYEYFINYDSLALSGLTIKYNNDIHPKRATDPVRLDDLIAVSGVNSKKPDQDKYDAQDQLVKDFLSFCAPWSDTKPYETHTTNSNFYSATSSVYVDYQNTQYDPMKKDSGGQYTSYCTVKDMEVNNYKISTHSYDYLTGAYNEQNTYVGDYKTNDYKKEYDAAKTDVITETVFISISLLFTVHTTLMCAAPAFLAKLPIYCVMLVIAWISLGGQTAMLALNYSKKMKPLGKFVDSINNIKSSEELKTFDKEIQKSKEENYLCSYDKITHHIKKEDYEAGYNKFMTGADFFEDVLPAMDYYQNVSSLKSYQDFYDKVEANKVDPKTYQDEMHVWDSAGGCTIAYYTLMAATFVLDISLIVMICKNPELGNWAIMKQAVNEARESGQSTKSAIEIYKRLKKTADYIQKLEKTLKSGKSAVSSLDKVGCNSAYEFLSANKIALEADQGYKAAESLGKGFTSFLDSAAASGLSLGEVSKFSQKIIESGQGGFAAILSSMTGFSTAGKVTKAGKCVMSETFTCLGSALGINQFVKGSQVFETLSLECFENVCKSLSGGAKQLLRETVIAGSKALQAGRVADAMQFVKNIDHILFDTKYLISSATKSSQFICSQMSGAARVIYKTINDTCNTFIKDINVFIKFVVS